MQLKHKEGQRLSGKDMVLLRHPPRLFHSSKENLFSELVTPPHLRMNEKRIPRKVNCPSKGGNVFGLN